MCNQCNSILLHNHSDRGSNLKLRDTTNRVEDLIQTVHDMGHKGVAFTEHESISSHVKAIQVTEKLKKDGKIDQDFKLILGNEIYLVDSLEEVRDNYQSGGVTKFPHFILLAKDEAGHEQIRYMSSVAWEQSYFTGPMLRTPTVKDFLRSVVDKNPGHLIASSACLGSPHCLGLLEMKKCLEEGDLSKAEAAYQKVCDFTDWCIDVFGKDDFYLELQPAYSEEQIYCNKELLKLAEKFDLKYIVTTDSHYLRPEDRIVHKAFLNAKEGEREVDAFYEATFVQNHDEISERLNYLSHDVIKQALDYTMEIGNKIEDFTLIKPTVIPKIDLPDFELRGTFKSIYNKYEFINKMAHAPNPQDKYIVKLIEDGFYELIPYNTYSNTKLHEVAQRIDTELGELWKISENLNQSVASYYITVREIVNVIWDDDCGNSLVGPARGSAAGYLICYLLGITQINPLEYGIEMPHWRHLTSERPEFPDIDIDTEAAKRDQIFRQLKKYFGDDRVLQVCTFGTEASKSAVQTAARGLGIDNDTAMFVSGLIPFERGSSWTLNDCVNGNKEKEREPVTEFINQINKHENWLKVSMKIEGLINKRSIHASGVIVFNEEFYKSNAMMTAPNGTHVTQFSLEDCEAVSNMKFDLLTIEGLDKIRVSLDKLLERNLMEWQGNLRSTYNKYLHPTVIDIESPEVYELIGQDSITDLFQFSTEIGIQTVKRTKPTNLIELASANSLMRLMGGGHGKETPIDSFIRFKNNIGEWYDELHENGLNEDEIKTMEEHLLKLNGVADTQESIMLLSMDKRVAGFTIKDANKLRKVIAKKKADEIEDIKNTFYGKGLELGNRHEILEYVWNVQIVRQLGYSFSVLHTLAYSIIALQEASLNINYDPIYWRTACLTVNSASVDDNRNDDEEENHKAQSTNYGKIAAAIGNMQSRGVKIGLPSINKAGFGFEPDIQNNQIIFGLKGINGIGDDVVQNIIKNRPYNSFDDFIVRMHDSSIIKKSQVLQLIKAGCFEEFGNRINVMTEFISKLYVPKTKLNLQNLNAVIESKIVPKEMNRYTKLFNFRKYVMKSVYKKDGKEKFYKLDSTSTPFYYEHFSGEGIIDYHNNFPIIKETTFKKEYDKKMEGIKEWLSTTEVLELFNAKQYEKEWYTYADGTISKWEMDSLSFYYTEHELKDINKEKYGIVDFSNLPEDPIVTEMMQFRNGARPKYKLNLIAGTVLDKDKNKNTVTILTVDGVVTVKYYDGAFAHYNKQISKPKPDGSKEVVEKTWFSRGNKLVLYGYRRGAQFRPYRYKDSPINHTTMLINKVDSNGNIKVTQERAKV
ncbi:PHP domain-containing protein [Paenibacillus illinoisensis]|uniref:DNA-directed DNA polymerase n=1 Tax=Paenibacillus illinoisensis TaxID=59845 RepID=A0A2W0CWX6_9BACL|nr:PHP domain-containing protein [Paenibacillus illinoisensis]PYY28161.1 putative DNA polymerase YorL [Paenibacillus illinoisensis]